METPEQRMKRYEKERNDWKPKLSEKNQELTQEQLRRYLEERRSWGLPDLK